MRTRERPRIIFKRHSTVCRFPRPTVRQPNKGSLRPHFQQYRLPFEYVAFTLERNCTNAWSELKRYACNIALVRAPGSTYRYYLASHPANRLCPTPPAIPQPTPTPEYRPPTWGVHDAAKYVLRYGAVRTLALRPFTQMPTGYSHSGKSEIGGETMRTISHRTSKCSFRRQADRSTRQNLKTIVSREPHLLLSPEQYF